MSPSWRIATAPSMSFRRCSPRSVRESPVEKRAGRLREYDLPSVAGGCDPRSEVNVVSDVALVGHERRPRVQADAQVDPARCECLGHRLCRGDCARRGREGEEERVSLRVDLDAALGRAGLTHDARCSASALVRTPRRRAQCKELRRALDVGEEERDGAGREVSPH